MRRLDRKRKTGPNTLVCGFGSVNLREAQSFFSGVLVAVGLPPVQVAAGLPVGSWSSFGLCCSWRSPCSCLRLVLVSWPSPCRGHVKMRAGRCTASRAPYPLSRRARHAVWHSRKPKENQRETKGTPKETKGNQRKSKGNQRDTKGKTKETK